MASENRFVRFVRAPLSLVGTHTVRPGVVFKVIEDLEARGHMEGASMTVCYALGLNPRHAVPH